MQIRFPKLAKHQEDVYNAVKDSFASGKVFVVKSRRQTGKSTLANIILITFALLHKGTKNYQVEPSNNQCRNQYLEIQKWLKDAPFVDKFNNQLNEIYFTNGSVIKFFSGEVRERLRGYTCTGITILDEMAFLSDDVIDNVLPWLDVHKCPLLCFSTPMFCDGYFYEWYSTADNKTSFSFDWASGKYDMSDFISDEKLEFYRQRVSPLKFRSEYLGLFIEDGSFVFRNVISSVCDRTQNPPVFGGLDFGTGQNQDSTVLTLLDKNGHIHSIYAFNDLSPNEQITKLAEIINKYPTLKCVNCEVNSIGSIYFDLLKQKVIRTSIIKKFITTNESKRRIIESLASAFENGDMRIINDAELIKQLQHYTVEKTKSGGVTYNGVGAHDDYVMSLAFAYDNLNTKRNTYNISFN